MNTIFKICKWIVGIIIAMGIILIALWVLIKTIILVGLFLTVIILVGLVIFAYKIVKNIFKKVVR